MLAGLGVIGLTLLLAGASEISRGTAYLLGVGFLLALAAEWQATNGEGWLGALFRRVGLGASFLLLFALPTPEVALSLGAALIGAFVLGMLERRGLPRLATLAIAPVAVAFIAFALETWLTRSYPLEAGRWGEYPALTPHPTRAYALKPNLSIRLRYNDYDYPLVTNADSLVGPVVPAARSDPRTLRILTVGDAFTMPEGLPAAKGWPALLAEHLGRCLAPRPVEVINAGVTGYGPAEEAPVIEELVPRYHPDVVLYEVYINEFDEAGLSAAARRASIGWGAAQSRRVRLLERSQLVAHDRRLDSWWRARITGTLTPTEARVAMTSVYAAGPSARYSPERLEQVEGFLVRMAHAAKDARAELILYHVPGALAVDPTELNVGAAPLEKAGPFDVARPAELTAQLAARAGIPEVDLTPALKAWPEHPRYFPRSWHWTEAGHRAAAQAILTSLTERGLLGTSCAP
jgi:hypothetical protein